MALRALLFSADGDSTSTLCHVLTGLGIEAEICADLLMAVERATKGGYDAIVVDWEQQDDTIFFLKALHEVKPTTPGLALALVRSDADVGGALQAGANSIIRKPVNQQQAQDTFSTAKDLILTWHTEQKVKEERLAAAQDTAVQADAATEPIPDKSREDEPAAPKTGFLSQSAPRSALEAEEIAREQNPTLPDQSHEEGPTELPHPQEEAAKPDPLLTWRQMQEKKAAAVVPQPSAVPPPDKAEPAELPAPEPRSQDATGVFSSYIEAQDTESQPAPSSRRTFAIVTVTAAVLVLGGLYAWAPGHSNLGRVLWRLNAMITGEPRPAIVPPAPAPAPVANTAQTERKALDPAPPDPFAGIVPDTNSDNVHVIETKAIPVAGAQQPPPPDKTPFLAQGQTPPRSEEPPDTPIFPVEPSEPAPQGVSVESPAPPQLPQAPPVSSTAAAPVPPPSAQNPAGEARNAPVIPDSLRTGPPAAPASSLEPALLPEETSRGFVMHSVDPVYPPQAIQQGMEGPVVLQAWVGKDGLIHDVKLVRGYFVLGRAAVDAVKQWRFRPYNVNGKSTDFQTYITINFKLPS